MCFFFFFLGGVSMQSLLRRKVQQIVNGVEDRRRFQWITLISLFCSSETATATESAWKMNKDCEQNFRNPAALVQNFRAPWAPWVGGPCFPGLDKQRNMMNQYESHNFGVPYFRTSPIKFVGATKLMLSLFFCAWKGLILKLDTKTFKLVWSSRLKWFTKSFSTRILRVSKCSHKNLPHF